MVTVGAAVSTGRVAVEAEVVAAAKDDGVPVGAEDDEGRLLPVVGTPAEVPPLPVAGEVKEGPDVVKELCVPVAEEGPDPSGCETVVV